MELRVLNYFLTIVQEKSILHAAQKLHLTQPTLSRQIKDLEEELGKQLFIRGNREITLTKEGELLRKRAEELIELANKTKNELSKKQGDLSGDITIGSGETLCIKPVLQCIKTIQSKYPNIHFHIRSGDKDDLQEKLDHGLFDFSIIIDNVDKKNYHFYTLPSSNQFCILAKKEDPLASFPFLTTKQLQQLSLIVSNQSLKDHYLPNDIQTSQIIATYNLFYNAALMVKEGIGYAIVLDHLNSFEDLITIPLERNEPLKWSIIWKRNQPLSEVQELFLNELKNHL